MHGRQRAFQKELTSEMLNPDSNLVYVPPVSILNAVDFDVVNEPEICLIDEVQKTMKWTCMYTASLIQEHMRVDRYAPFAAFLRRLFEVLFRPERLSRRRNPRVRPFRKKSATAVWYDKWLRAVRRSRV